MQLQNDVFTVTADSGMKVALARACRSVQPCALVVICVEADQARAPADGVHAGVDTTGAAGVYAHQLGRRAFEKG